MEREGEQKGVRKDGEREGGRKGEGKESLWELIVQLQCVYPQEKAE